LRLFSFGGYGLAFAALALVVFGAYDSYPHIQYFVTDARFLCVSGLSVDSVGRSVNGMLVLAVAPGGALYRDGRIVPGDFLVAVNNENLRNVTNSQARAILRRAQLLTTDIR